MNTILCVISFLLIFNIFENIKNLLLIKDMIYVSLLDFGKSVIYLICLKWYFY